MAVQQYSINETGTTKRDFCIMLVDATDGMTPETGEAAGQPQIRKPGQTTWANTSDTLVHVGNGHYVILLITSELDTVGVFSIRYKSANTAEFQDVGVIKNEGAVNNDDINRLLVELKQKVDWIEYILSKGTKSAVTQKELNIL